MRTIDMQSWPRRAIFEMFMTFEHPHAGMTANVDLTVFYPYLKEHSIRTSAAIIYVLARAANDIPEFRTRIRKDLVVEHELVHPSITVMGNKDLFGFCSLTYTLDYLQFAAEAEQSIAEVQANPNLIDPPGRDDLLFMTAIPWVSFTGVLHPMPRHPGDSIPRIAWGKFFANGASLLMPVGIQGHHALMDGLHVGRYLEAVQSYLDDPQATLVI